MSKRSMLITSVMIVIIVVMVYIITTNDNKVTYAVGETLASVVINQSQGTTWNIGATGVYNTKYTKEDGTTIGNDYRYIGANVKNYVRFNNDMYQIIGVFDENTHGKTGQQLVKLIRAKLIGSYSWGVVNTGANTGTYSAYTNDWTGKENPTPASANILLNEYFYNKTEQSLTYGNCSNWTYFHSSNNYKTNDCQTLVGYGIKEGIRDYIEITTWHLNGYNSSYSELTSNNYYLCERGMYTGCASSNTGAGDTATSAKIGLMYPSDYMYASGGYQADDYWSYPGCQNWMYKGYEWTISPNSNSNDGGWHVVYYSSIFTTITSYSYGIRPTFYLKKDVYVTGGNGSFDNPYTVACDNCG